MKSPDFKTHSLRTAFGRERLFDMCQLSKGILIVRILVLSIMSLLPQAVCAEPANYKIRLDLHSPLRAMVEAELDTTDGSIFRCGICSDRLSV